MLRTLGNKVLLTVGVTLTTVGVALMILALTVTVAFGQCENGQCSTGQCPTPQPGVWRPGGFLLPEGTKTPAPSREYPKLEVGSCGEGWIVPSQPEQPKWRASAPIAPMPQAKPAAHKAKYPTVVRVICPRRDGRKDIGSGVYVRDGEWVCVLTCAHVVSDGSGKVSVRFPYGPTMPGTVVAKDVIWDIAVISIDPVPGVVASKLATERPTIGDTLTACGYGSTGFVARRGRFTAWAAPGEGSAFDYVTMSSTMRSGDSGGPVFDDQGRVVAVLFGSNKEGTVGSVSTRIRPLVLGWIAKACRGTRRVVVATPPPSARAARDTGLQQQVAALHKRILHLESVISTLAAKEGPRGEMGARGPAGLPGLRGVAGKPVSLNDVVKSVMAKLPPITIDYLGAGDSIHRSEQVYLGGTAIIPPMRMSISHPGGQTLQEKPLGEAISLELRPR